jgi:hypothetical protein
MIAKQHDVVRLNAPAVALLYITRVQEHNALSLPAQAMSEAHL